MNRDEIIMSCLPTVKNLVLKYHFHEPDEDLEQTGLMGVIRCVDRCLSENMTDLNVIQARCNVWAKNEILKAIYSPKIKTDDEGMSIEDYPDDGGSSLETSIFQIRDSVSDDAKQILDMLMSGFKDTEIMEALNMKKSKYYSIRKEISDYLWKKSKK